jgi:hypothetical protein
VRAYALLIDDEGRAAIKALIEKAEQNVTPLDTVVRLAVKRDEGMAINPMHDAFTIGLPVGFRVTYTHEEQRQCVCRHISISVGEEGRAPHPHAINLLLEEFGFVNRLGGIFFWVTESPDRIIAEAIEPLDGDMRRLRRQG